MTESMLNWALSFWANGLGTIKALLLLSPTTFSPEAWSVVTTIYHIIQGTAYGFMIVCCYLGLIKSGLTLVDLRRPEVAITALMRFLIAKLFIDSGLSLLIFMMRIGGDIISSVFSNGAFSPESIALPEEIVQGLADCGWLDSMKIWLVAVIAILVIIVQTLVIVLTVYGRFFRIYVLAAIGALPMAFMAGETTQHIAFHYLKIFGGVCLEGVVTAIACIIYTVILSAVPEISVSGDSLMVQLLSYIVGICFQTLLLTGMIRGADSLMSRMMGS